MVGVRLGGWSVALAAQQQRRADIVSAVDGWMPTAPYALRHRLIKPVLLGERRVVVAHELTLSTISIAHRGGSRRSSLACE